MGSYYVSLDDGDVEIAYGGTSSSPATSRWTLPEETEPGCSNGWQYSSRFPVKGVLAGGGDLDGDGFDDFVLVSRESHPGSSACQSGGPRVRVLYGPSSLGFAVEQTLAGPKPPPGDFASRLLFLDADRSRDDHLAIASWNTRGSTVSNSIPATAQSTPERAAR